MRRLLALLGLFSVALAPDAAGAAPAPAPQPPVLLVHGIDDTGAIFEKMVPALASSGRAHIHTIDLNPNNGDVDLVELARQVSRRVEAIRLADRAERVDLVGFSMGGMVSRYYVQKLGGVSRVRHFVTISSPHAGTIAAFFRWNAGAAQMRPYSAFLRELDESAAVLGQLDVTTIWSPLDMMIMPCWSSRLANVKERVIPVLAHPWMVRDERVCRAVVEALDGTDR